MTMSISDWGTFTPKTKDKNGDIMFVNGSNTQSSPVIVRPVGPIAQYEAVYDPALKRSRAPREGEKVTTKVLFNGVDLTGTLRVYQVGMQVAGLIKDLFDNLESTELYIEISSTGSNLKTKYSVKKHKAKSGKLDESKLALKDLDKIANSLVVPDAASKEPDVIGSIGDALEEMSEEAQSFAA